MLNKSSNIKKYQATINYKSIQKSVQVTKLTKIKELKSKFEVKSNFNLGKFKLIHIITASDLMLANENLSILEYLGEESMNSLLFNIVPKEFTEQYFIQMFEREYFKETEKDKENSKNKEKENEKEGSKQKLILPDIKNESIGQGNSNKQIIKERNYIEVEGTISNIQEENICCWDKLNKSTYICTKCMSEYCKECIKFDPHPLFLIEKSLIDTYIKSKRDKIKMEIEEKVLKDKNFQSLKRIDFLISDRIKQIEDQFEEMKYQIDRIKDSQTKLLIDLYYQQVDDKDSKGNKSYRTLLTDIDFLYEKMSFIEKEYKPGNEFIKENINNLKTIEKYKTLINSSYEDFSYKFNIFDNIYGQYENFNSSLVYVLESKYQSSNEIRKKLNETNIQTNENKSTQSNVIKSVMIMKINYYNSIYMYSNASKKLQKEYDFLDKHEFKVNYQVYDGNITLNWNGKLLIVTGNKFNYLYMYNYKTKEMSRLSDLKYNHSRGVLLIVNTFSLKKLLFCISGKNNPKVEMLDVSNFYEESNKDNEINSKKLEKTIYDNSINMNSSINNNIWTECSNINIQRYHFGCYFQNQKYIYIFFGINSIKGSIDTIERFDITKSESINTIEWEIVYYKNPKTINLNMHSFGLCRCNTDEVYIIGGVDFDNKYSNTMIKYNFSHESIGTTSFNIPDIDINEYYRFWEESNFICLKDNIYSYVGMSKNNDVGFRGDNDFYYGMFDVRNKFHLFNIKTFHYKVIG